MPKGLQGFQKGNKVRLGKYHSEEQKKKISENTKKAMWRNDVREKVEKISKSRRGEIHSQEHKNKISKALRGRNFGYKFKKGQKFSIQHKINISKAQKGRKHTEISKRKMSEAHKKNPTRYWLGKKKWYKNPEEWKRKISEGHRGKKHWNWKGGITPENAKIRNNIEFRLWREAVFARDNWTCQKCNERGGKLHSHHIQNFAQWSGLRTSIENGITLCRNCHKDFHKKYGIKNNNQGQIWEFLKTFFQSGVAS